MPKKIEKKTIKKETLYICEICKEEYHHNFQAEYCEKKHNCSHDVFKYYIDNKSMSIYMSDYYIVKECENCEIELGNYKIGGQKLYKKIYGILENFNSNSEFE